MKGKKGKYGLISKGDLLSKTTLPLEWKKLIAWSNEIPQDNFPALSWLVMVGDQGLCVHDIAQLTNKHPDFAEIVAKELIKDSWAKLGNTNGRDDNPLVFHNFTHKPFPPGVMITSRLVKKIRTQAVKKAEEGAKDRLRVSGRSTKKLDAIRDDQGQKKKRVYKKLARTPTGRDELNRWKSKQNPNRWRELDWVGFFLHKWKDYYGTENPVFISAKFHKFRPKGRDIYDSVFWETGILMVQCRDHDQGFCGQGQEMKAYIEWIFDEFLDDNQWMKTPITHQQMFRKSNNNFIPRFKMRTVKPKKKDRKWHAWGYTEE